MSSSLNPRYEEEEQEHIDEMEYSEVEEESPIGTHESPKLSQMATVYPPKPCDRCVRMKRTCKGIAGSRCEYCKRLKQKCSNATGPARGRHATRLAMLAAAAARGITPPPPTVPVASTSTWSARPKRKATSGKTPSQSLSGDEDDFDDGHEPPAKLNKKRRTSKLVTSPSPLRTKLLSRITELGDTVRQLQINTQREVDRINQILEELTDAVGEMDSTE